MLQPFVVSSAPMQGRPGSSPVRAFDQQRAELNDQLTSLTVQRDLLNQQLRNADPAGQKVLQQQITLVGERTISVMKQLAAVDEAASKALAEARPLVAGAGQGGGTAVTIIPPPSSDGLSRNEAQVAIFGMVSVVVLLVAAMQWFRRPKSASALSSADVNRIERLQQSVDVLAVEVERVSESQRYVSKILGEGKALGAGAAEEIRVAAKERVKAP